MSPAERALELLEILEPVEVTEKAMFGGRGLFSDGVMFVIVDKAGDVFLRADEETEPDFEAAGSHKHGMPYWSVPPEVMADDDEFRSWAATALGVAQTHRK